MSIGVTLLKSLSQAPEQGNQDLRKAIAKPNSRPVVRLDEFELVMNLWLEGELIETIFAALPANQRSKRKPALQTWLGGVSEDSMWTEQFAKFNDFMSNCLEFFLPWILRAARPLAEIDGQPERPWNEWARFVELGVGSTWGTLLIDKGPITDRMVALQIGKRLDELGSDNEPTLVQVQSVLADTLGEDSETARQVRSWFLRRSVAT